MKLKYKLIGECIVEIATSKTVMRLSLPKWESTLKFNLKILNGEIVPKWNDDNTVLIFVPA